MNPITNNKNLKKHDYKIQRSDYENRNGHKGKVLWLVGLSGSGKSTLANGIHNKLFELGMHSVVLDGDNTRLGINKDLDFSEQDRIENIRRVAEIAKLFVQSGHIVITAFISPFEINRQQAKEIISEDDFIEVYAKSSISKCEERDVKGLYKKVRAGEITHFTGITSPFDEPKNADICVDTEKLSINEGIEYFLNKLKSKL